VTVLNFVAISRTIAEIWRFDGFKIGGRPSFFIFKSSAF